LRLYLEEKGFEIVEASNGSAALMLIKRNGIGVIVVDLLMPTMDGFRFCKAMREIDSVIPIIVFTGSYTDFGDSIKALRAGATRVIAKPDYQSLLETLQEFLPSESNE
jgi:two-component system, OmpR family, response regulator ResD